MLNFKTGRSRTSLWRGRGVRWLGAATASLALVGTVLAGAAGAAPHSGIMARVYSVSMLGVAASPSAPVALPNTAACIAQFGLACHTPAQMRAAYDIPPYLNGHGQTIVIVDAYGSPTIRTDVATFDRQFHLPRIHLNIYQPTGPIVFNPSNPLEPRWAGETSLDVEWAHSIAPLATIDLVEATNPSFSTLDAAEAWAVQHNLGHIMSMSFGLPEGDLVGTGVIAATHPIYQMAAQKGWTIFSSAGDTGAASFLPAATASYPASDPLVTSVGGTDLFTTASGDYVNETVWNDGVAALCPYGCAYGPFGATGGAPSLTFSTPRYQQGFQSYGYRTTADVAWNASVYTSVWVYQSFPGVQAGYYFYGGTSEGSPSWAGVAADASQLAGRPLGPLNPILYFIGRHPALYRRDFHNITVGNNAFFGPGYAAGPGYNLPTGLGSPNVAWLALTIALGARVGF